MFAGRVTVVLIVPPPPAVTVPLTGTGVPPVAGQPATLWSVAGFTEPDGGAVATALEELKKILPKPEPAIEATEVDEVEFDSDADIEDVSFEPVQFWEIF